MEPPPSDIDRYIASADAIAILEQITKVLRMVEREGDLLKWDITVWFYNHDQNRPRREFSCHRTTFKTQQPGQHPQQIGQAGQRHHPDVPVTGQ